MVKSFAVLAAAVLIGLSSPAAAKRVAPAPVSGQLAGSDMAETTNATQTTVVQAQIVESSCATATVYVMAYRPSDGVSKCWQIEAGIKRIGDEDASLMGSVLNLVTPHGDLGAALWAATVDIDGSLLRVRVTGGLASTIEWYAVISGHCVTYTP